MYVTMKIYYDNVTGEIVWYASYDHSFTPNFERDYESISTLNERTKESLSLHVLENGEYAQDFAEGRLVGINVDTKVPIFEYPNPENPEKPVVVLTPFSVQIANLQNRDANLQDDLNFVLEMLGG